MLNFGLHAVLITVTFTQPSCHSRGGAGQTAYHKDQPSLLTWTNAEQQEQQWRSMLINCWLYIILIYVSSPTDSHEPTGTSTLCLNLTWRLLIKACMFKYIGFTVLSLFFSVVSNWVLGIMEFNWCWYQLPNFWYYRAQLVHGCRRGTQTVPWYATKGWNTYKMPVSD